jgi:hypothetical protein
MSGNTPDDEQERTRRAHIDAILERDERDRHVREWLWNKGLCIWRIVFGLGVVLTIAKAAIEFPAVLGLVEHAPRPPAVDRGVPYRPAGPDRITRGH